MTIDLGEDLGSRLRRRRRELGLFQKDAAKRLGVCVEALINWEKVRSVPAPKYYPAIITFLGTEPSFVSDGMHLYAYVGNDPINFVDPRGEAREAAKLAWRVGKPVAEWLPVVGDALGFYDFYQNPTALGALAAIVGLAPGAGDLAGKALRHADEVADAEKLLFRRGAQDTRGALESQAAAAERNEKIGIHGVSVSTDPTPRYPGQVVRCATCGAVEDAGFRVYKTGNDPAHYTVELPKPITSEVTRIWNDLFN